MDKRFRSDSGANKLLRDLLLLDRFASTTHLGNTTGLEITAGHRTMSGLIVDLTGQTFVLPVMLTGQNSVVLKMK